MSSPDASPRPDVIAAGAVVVRKHASGRGHEVLLIHRPRYDDWSFPKGKRDRGEHVVACAVREVEEETGLRVALGLPLSGQRYQLENGRMKTVHYWTARVNGDAHAHHFVPNDEVDEVRWLGWDEAAALLTQVHDRATLAEARERRRRTRAVVVLRHASAISRAEWSAGESDRARPLTPRGAVQSAALAPVLDAWAPEALRSSPALRCVDTLGPYATSSGLDVTRHEELSEEGDAEALNLWMRAVVVRGRASVLCSHSPVLPEILGGLGLTPDQGPASPLGTADLLVAHVRDATVVATEVHTLV